MTMCADGRQVRCCGGSCCPGPAATGGGTDGVAASAFSSFFQGFMQGIQNPRPPAQRQPTPGEMEKARIEAERLQREADERERKNREEDDRRRRERQELLKTQKGEPLPEGPLPMKESAPEPGESQTDPWCYENTPQADCDPVWEARCGAGPGACKKTQRAGEAEAKKIVDAMRERLRLQERALCQALRGGDGQAIRKAMEAQGNVIAQSSCKEPKAKCTLMPGASFPAVANMCCYFCTLAEARFTTCGSLDEYGEQLDGIAVCKTTLD